MRDYRFSDTRGFGAMTPMQLTVTPQIKVAPSFISTMTPQRHAVVRDLIAQVADEISYESRVRSAITDLEMWGLKPSKAHTLSTAMGWAGPHKPDPEPWTPAFHKQYGDLRGRPQCNWSVMILDIPCTPSNQNKYVFQNARFAWAQQKIRELLDKTPEGKPAKDVALFLTGPSQSKEKMAAWAKWCTDVLSYASVMYYASNSAYLVPGVCRLFTDGFEPASAALHKRDLLRGQVISTKIHKNRGGWKKNASGEWELPGPWSPVGKEAFRPDVHLPARWTKDGPDLTGRSISSIFEQFAPASWIPCYYIDPGEGPVPIPGLEKGFCWGPQNIYLYCKHVATMADKADMQRDFVTPTMNEWTERMKRFLPSDQAAVFAEATELMNKQDSIAYLGMAMSAVGTAVSYIPVIGQIVQAIVAALYYITWGFIELGFELSDDPSQNEYPCAPFPPFLRMIESEECELFEVDTGQSWTSVVPGSESACSAPPSGKDLNQALGAAGVSSKGGEYIAIIKGAADAVNAVIGVIQGLTGNAGDPGWIEARAWLKFFTAGGLPPVLGESEYKILADFCKNTTFLDKDGCLDEIVEAMSVGNNLAAVWIPAGAGVAVSTAIKVAIAVYFFLMMFRGSICSDPKVCRYLWPDLNPGSSSPPPPPVFTGFRLYSTPPITPSNEDMVFVPDDPGPPPPPKKASKGSGVAPVVVGVSVAAVVGYALTRRV